MSPIRHLFSALAVVFVMAAISPIHANAQDLAAQERAAAAVESGRYQEAVTMLNTIIVPGTRDTRALVLRARAYEGLNNVVAAAADYEAALKIDSTLAEATEGLERTRARTGSNRGKLDSLRRLMEDNPENAVFRVRYADALYDAQLYEEAARQYGAFLDGTQGTPDIVQRYLISIANYKGDNALGERVAEKYVQLYTTDDDLWMRLGYFRLWQGAYGPAISAFEQALKLNPNSVDSRRGLAQAQDPEVENQSSTFPIDVLMRDLRSNPDQDDKRFQLVDLFMDAGRYFEARQQLDLLAARHRDNEIWKRKYQLATNRLQTAPSSRLSTFPIDVLTRELMAKPGQDAKRFRLVDLLIDDSRFFEAKQNLDYLARRHRNDANWQRRYNVVSRRLAALNDGGRSRLSTYPIDVLTRMLMSDPTLDSKRFELVDLLLNAGRYFEAKQNLDYLSSDHRGSSAWQRRYRAAQAGLERSPSPRTTPTQEFVVDRLLRELRANPDNDDKRFALIDQLVKYSRFQEGYDQLLILEPRHGESRRWLSSFAAVDDGLARAPGGSSIFPIDRYTYRLRYEPGNANVRYALVDALVNAGRAAEALDILTDARFVDAADERYQSRLRTVSEMRLQQAQQRIAMLENRVAERADDREALRELADQYTVVSRVDDALSVYATLLRLEPNNPALRARYADVLRANGYHEEAMMEIATLLQTQPDNQEFQRIYVLAAIGSGGLDQLGETYAQRLLGMNDRNDPELLLDLAQFRLAQGDAEAADALLRRADGLGDGRYTTRIRTLGQLVSREKIRLGEQSRIELLNEARRFAAARNFDAAIDAYEDYFDAQGRRSRAELKELAQVHTAAGEFVEALSILKALQEQAYEYDVAKEIARNQIFRADYSGALTTLQILAAENPRDYEVKFLQADAYRELGLYDQANQIYEEARRLAAVSETVESRTAVLDVSMRARLAESGEWRGYDFAGIIVPTAEATVARGGGTRYDRWAQGMQTQVTLPIGAVLIAGVKSHFISGTRRLVPGSLIARGRLNQVFAGGYIDLTPPIRANDATYTNRVSIEGGLFDYEGGRTVGFGGIRYWRQEHGVYQASAGLRTTEGAIDLWSAGGGEFRLGLTQFDIKAESASVLPDSVLRLQTAMAFNVVRDAFGTLGTTTDTNFGRNILLEASYRVVPYTFFGITYYQIDYRTTTDLYFSPRNYETYDFFLEYERDFPDRWYVRLRGAMGLIARSAGFVSRRIELDVIKRLRNNLSFTMSSSLGQSTRSLGSGATSFIDRYNTFTFSGALYWTL